MMHQKGQMVRDEILVCSAWLKFAFERSQCSYLFANMLFLHHIQVALAFTKFLLIKNVDFCAFFAKVVKRQPNSNQIDLFVCLSAHVLEISSLVLL